MKRWTKEEENIIISARERGEFPEIEGRTKKSIQCKISKLIEQGLISSQTGAKPWKSHEDDLLIQLYNDKISYAKMAEKLERSVSSVDRRLSILEGRSKVLRSKKPRLGSWSVEDIDRVRNLIVEGCQYSYIAELMNRSTSAIRTLASTRSLGTTMEYTDEYLLELVGKYRVQERLDYFREEGEPSSMVVRARFGGWSNALELAGLDPNSGALKFNGVTYLYLVDFGGFKKVGITQRSVESRFRGFPKFKLLDLIKFENLEEALGTEREILRKIRGLRVNPGLPNGNSECFVSSMCLLEELL